MHKHIVDPEVQRGEETTRRWRDPSVLTREGHLRETSQQECREDLYEITKCYVDLRKW